MTKNDKIMIDPKCSAVMYEVSHFLYVWLIATAEGDIKPMLDFLQNGKYHQDYLKNVKFDEGCQAKWKMEKEKLYQNEQDEAVIKELD